MANTLCVYQVFWYDAGNDNVPNSVIATELTNSSMIVTG
uniref:Uncharacterized protein n=1 Tax=Bracon brevicornis TaxID=1563983 RepID=A0A6V7HR32_9HYME